MWISCSAQRTFFPSFTGVYIYGALCAKTMTTLGKSYFDLRVETDHAFVILVAHSWGLEWSVLLNFESVVEIFWLPFWSYCVFRAIWILAALEFQTIRSFKFNFFVLILFWFFVIILIRMESHHRNNFFYELYKIIKFSYINLLLYNSLFRFLQMFRYPMNNALLFFPIVTNINTLSSRLNITDRLILTNVWFKFSNHFIIFSK